MAHTISTPTLEVQFAGAEEGFSCIGITNKLTGTRFVTYRGDTPGLWQITFRKYGQDRTKPEIFSYRNNQKNLPQGTCVELPNGLRFQWQGLHIPNEPHALDVACDVTVNDEGAVEWRIQLNSRSKTFGLWETQYPYLQTISPPGEGDALFPIQNYGGRLVKNCKEGYCVAYPGAMCPLQMFAFLREGGGLYIAAHDGQAAMKFPMVSRRQDCFFTTPATDAGVPGACGGPQFPVVVQAFKGDWYAAAKLYRAWATKQYWTRQGPVATRKDLSPDMTKPGYWFVGVGSPAPILKTIAGLRARLDEQGAADLPIKFHWYSWTNERFDTRYPKVTAKEGFGEAVRELQKNGVLVMPYTNGRMYDTELPDWESVGKPLSCLNPEGGFDYETCNSKFTVLCPYAAANADTWYTPIQEFQDRYGLTAIYLDQVASGNPKLCFNPNHGHPVGGGNFWTQGYNRALHKIREKTGMLMTVENTAEPYMAEVDGFLSWWERRGDDVPLMPAVYSGYTIYFTSPFSWEDADGAYQASLNRDLIWGSQMSWMGPELFYLQREKFNYLVKLVQLHQVSSDFFVTGELLGEIPLCPPEDTVTYTWLRLKTHEATLPAMQSAVWRDFEGKRLLLAVANHSDQERTIIDATGAFRQFLPSEAASRACEIFHHAYNGDMPLGQVIDGSLPPLPPVSPHEVQLFLIRL